MMADIVMNITPSRKVIIFVTLIRKSVTGNPSADMSTDGQEDNMFGYYYQVSVW